ncbi:MAG: SPOR domain-containing protein [Pseudomonadota bacterium]
MKYTLKHRLIGAAFLAAIAVIFLPGFFKEKQDNQISTKSQIPVRPGIVPVEFNAPKPVPDIVPAPAPETMFVPDETVEQTIISSAPSSLPASSKPSQVIAPAQKAVTAMPLNAEDLPNAWVVQVGSFSTKEAANKVRDDLQVDGFKAYVRTVPSGATTISRVYVGPKLDKAEALTMKSQIDKRLKVKSMVMQFRP